MKEFNESNYCDELINNCVATEPEIFLVADICGWSIKTLNDILYARTGMRDWDQYCDENNVENVFVEEIEDEDYE